MPNLMSRIDKLKRAFHTGWVRRRRRLLAPYPDGTVDEWTWGPPLAEKHITIATYDERFQNPDGSRRADRPDVRLPTDTGDTEADT